MKKEEQIKENDLAQLDTNVPNADFLVTLKQTKQLSKPFFKNVLTVLKTNYYNEETKLFFSNLHNELKNLKKELVENEKIEAEAGLEPNKLTSKMQNAFLNEITELQTKITAYLSKNKTRLALDK